MSKLTTKTSLIASALNKVSKGASNDKSFPITSLIGIIKKDNKLYFRSTDKRNELQVCVEVDSGEDFNISVNATLMVNLVNKITSGDMSFEINESTLIITGDGKYKIPIVTDSEGFVTFDFIEVDKNSELMSIDIEPLKAVFELNNAIISKKNIYPPILENYCFSDSILTSDGDLICSTGVDLFKSKNILINVSTINLLQQISDKSISVLFTANSVYFITDTTVLKSIVSYDVSEYPIEESIGYFAETVGMCCTVPTGLMCSTLDRLGLFLDDYVDSGDVMIDFSKTSLSLKSVQNSAEEVINYTKQSNTDEDFRAFLSLASLKKALDNWPEDTVTIRYGNASLIILVAKNMSVALGLSTPKEVL